MHVYARIIKEEVIRARFFQPLKKRKKGEKSDE